MVISKLKIISQFIILILVLGVSEIFSQSDFVYIKGNEFFLKNSEFKFFGFNAYYLQSLTAAYPDRNIVDEVFNAADSIGVKVIRTWGFNDSGSGSNPGVIRYAPYSYNELGLKALDFIVAKADEYNIKLILTLTNNFPDYGGIPQYVKWANKYLKKSNGKNFDHNDFFTNDSIKSWYKSYIFKILNRTNTYSKIKYKDDPAIFSFELVNEANNPGKNSNIILAWYKEMSSYFKSIDNNHLLTTGEMGYDISNNNYSNTELFYNSEKFLFDGSKGTSFTKNSELKDIDYTSFHLYSGAWNISYPAGRTWIKDHLRISDFLNKPGLLGEFAVSKDKVNIYSDWLNVIQEADGSKSALVWQYLHPSVKNYDTYGFNLKDSSLINLFKNFIEIINQKRIKQNILDKVTLYQNYPNPFNPVTTIRFSLPDDGFIEMDLYSSIGEKIGTLIKRFLHKGEHEITLSFNSRNYASGVYIYVLKTSHGYFSRKLILLK